MAAHNLLRGARVYLSGPMDFVASRAEEKAFGWRNRMTRYLRSRGAVVFDPWNKPEIRGLEGYGREDEHTHATRERWTFRDDAAGAAERAACAEWFWPILHIDLRMVDVADFVIAYVPTNVYSVGTPHEIILARQQHKPVLMVCPPVRFPALERLRAAVAGNAEGEAALAELERSVPIKENPAGIPSSWYMPLLNGEHFFDGFGFGLPGFADEVGWDAERERDAHERDDALQRPLLPFLEQLVEGRTPAKWDRHRCAYAHDDNWLLLDLGEGGLKEGSAP
jgi:hypothetical protein